MVNDVMVIGLWKELCCIFFLENTMSLSELLMQLCKFNVEPNCLNQLAMKLLNREIN